MHQIGAGALGPVFRAYEPDQDRLVAVKLFRLDLPPERVHQLVAELERLIAADLTHPSIAAPIAAGISGTSAYFAQDFVAADSLDIVVREHGPAPASDALRVAAQLGGALDFAAAVDVVHGALHPRDVLLSADDTRVIGHGIARALEKVGVVAPIRRPYTAPERAAGAAWDRRADIYTLAALIYEMLAGKRLAVPGDQAGEGLAAAAGANASALKRVFAQALADDPGKRFETALEFADALKSALTVVAHQPAPRAAAVERTSEEAQHTRSEREIALPFEEAHPAEAFDTGAAFEPSKQLDGGPELEIGRALEPSIDLQLHEEVEAVIQLRDDVPAKPVEPAAASPPPAARRPRVARPIEPVSAAAPLQDSPPEPQAVRSSPAPVKPDADNSARRRDAPTAFLDQSTEEFRESALEKTRSAVWPLALAIGVGLVVGFAGGYGVAMRDRLMPLANDTAPAVAQVAPPAAPAPAPPAVETPTQSPASPAPDAPAAISTPPPSKPEEPAQDNGRLVVRSTPAGARVSVDGKDAGATPATVRDLARGPHNIRVTQDGYTTQERRIVLTDDRMSQAMRFELARKAVPGAAPAPLPGPGGLMVESRPTGASVFVDGKLVGTTPLAIESVDAGDHSIGIARDGYQRWVGSVRVATGERARVTASLER